MSEQYGLSEYPDVPAIYEKINKLMSIPVQKIKKDNMKEYLNYFDEKCVSSKTMITEAKKYIPGGVQHNLAFNYPFPLVIDKAEGAYLYDRDGNKYIDFLQAGGPTILGSNYPLIKEKAIHVINEYGPSTGLFHEYELKIAKEVNKHMPGIEKFRMLGSGTEAVMAALRVARVATKKKKIIKVGGSYHGWSDQMVYGMHIPGSGRFEAHGLPWFSNWHTQEVFPNDINALKKRLRGNKLRGGTAAVILEPLGPESGTRPIDYDYNKQVRELCDDYGAKLIFDEVVTGFRVGLGGAQGYFGVNPDLTVFGKVMAGGYPAAGGLGGNDEMMSYVAAGVEGNKKRAYMGGTMAANPLSAAAGYYTIKEIEKTNACVKAGNAGDKITKELQELIENYNLPFVAFNQGSIVHLETSGVMFLKIGLKEILGGIGKLKKEINARKHGMEEYGAAYMAEGIVTLAGSRLYTSMATTDEVVNDAVERFDRVFQNVEVTN